MSAPGFVHLRVHTEYSVSDSIVRIDALVERALADEQPAIAVTDLANLFGWVKFYKAARARGIKPICGVDAWVSNETDRERPFRMLLLARDRGGYLRLCELISRAWIENEYRGRGELRAEWFDERDAEGRLEIAGLLCAPGEERQACTAIAAACGEELRLRPGARRHDPPTPAEIALLRAFDPARAILG